MAYTRVRSETSDQNQAVLDKVALSVFRDMGIITKEQYDSVLDDVRKQIDLLQSIKDLQGEQAKDFAERFIDKIVDVDNKYDTNWFDLVPPSTLAKAYSGTKEKLEGEGLPDDQREYLQRRLDKISKRIDKLIEDFATYIGYFFIDPTNMADVYAGYKEMFDVREPDLPEGSDLRTHINNNRITLEDYIHEYDTVTGISGIEEKESDVKAIEKNYDDALKKATQWTPSEQTLRSASKYKFLDEQGNAKPQFKNENGELTADYESGYELNDKGELQGVIDLVRHDFALHHVKDDTVSQKSEEEINKELDDGVLYKLFEIDTAEQIVKGCQEDSDRFTNPKHFQDFVNKLNADGGTISQQGYDAAMDAQVNKTAGFASRIKQKLGKFGDKATGFFGKIFKPIQKIDKRAKDRIQGQSPKDKRQKRIEFFLRILKGFGCAFLVSAALTTVATAGAAIAGVGLAVSIATVGVVTATIMSAIQIHKWRKARRAAGEDDSIKALLKDKRMLATLGTSAIASIALIFGASGLTSAAVALGYGALTLGAANNSITTFKDAKAAGMGTAESIAWALANAAAVIAGGFAGRATANHLINSYNNAHPDNRVFQKEETHQEYQKIGEHEETEQAYKPETLENAERITKMWYRDNPDLLQHRVDMVNDYNATHGTHIDPYRAVLMNADAGGMTSDNMLLHNQYGPDIHTGGHHTVFTPRWAAEHGFSMDEVNAMAHMFDGNQISDAAIQAAMKADNLVSPINEVGNITNRPFQNDMVLHPNTVDAHGNPIYTTYANGASPYTVTTNVVEDFGFVDVVKLGPVGVPWAMGTFGNYNKKHKSKLKERPGSKADQEKYIPEPQQGNNDNDIVPPESNDNGDAVVPPHADEPKNKDEEEINVPEPHEENKSPVEPVEPVVTPEKLNKNDGWAQGNTGGFDYPEDWQEEQGSKQKRNDGWAQGNTGGFDYPEDWQEEIKAPKYLPVSQRSASEMIALPSTKELLALPESSEQNVQPKYLRISRADAYDIWAKGKDILREEQKLANPNLKDSERQKIIARKKKWEQELRERKNKLGNPTESDLDDAMYWAFRKEDLENAEKELNEYQQRKITAGTSRFEQQEIEMGIAKSKEKIAEYKAEIPDDSYFYDPESVQYDKESGTKIPKFKKATAKIKKLMAQKQLETSNFER